MTPKIPTTVPKSPIKGDVEAMIETFVNPLVELRMVSTDRSSSKALLM